MCTFWHSRPTKHIGCSYTKSYFNQFGEIPKSFPQQKSFSPTADICQTNFLSSASFVRLGNFSQGLLLSNSTGAPRGQLQKAPPGILANCNCSHDAMKYLDIFSHQLAQGLSHCFPYVDKKFPFFPMFWQKITICPFLFQVRFQWRRKTRRLSGKYGKTFEKGQKSIFWQYEIQPDQVWSFPQKFLAPVRGNFLSFPLNEHLESESGWNPCSV